MITTDTEYRTSFSEIPADFPNGAISMIEQLKALNPVPPKGANWKLHSAAVDNGRIFFFWYRPNYRTNPQNAESHAE